MGQQSLITEDMRKAIGAESEPVCFEVEKGAIKKLLRAMGDANPLWSDPEVAGRSRYGGLAAPPAYLLSIQPRAPKVKIETSLTRKVGGGNEWEFLAPLRPGDTVVAKRRIADIYEKDGKKGKMLFVVYEDTFALVDGRVVAMLRATQILY